MPFVDTRTLEPREPLAGLEGRFFHSDRMTFGYYEVRAGTSIGEHDHPQEEVWFVMEGELEVTLDGETRVVGPGCAVVAPANTRHAVRALTDARALVVDHPRRERVGDARTD